MKNTSLRTRSLALVASMVLGAGAASAVAGEITLDVGGAESFDNLGVGINNTILTFDLNALLGTAPGSRVDVDGVGWDVEIEAFGDSWLSESTANFGFNSGSNSFNLAPGAGSDFPGLASFSSGGIVELATAGLPNLVLDDGILILEFFETFVDPVSPNARWLEGSTITVRTLEDDISVPAPPALLLLAGGLGLLAMRRRRPAA